MRVFTYERISRITERTTSVARQREHNTAMATQRGWDVVDRFSDEGVSGATDPDERPAMRRMLARLNEVDAIIFYRLDRLCRSTLAFAGLMDRCERAGVALVSVTEPLDLSTPMGRAMAEIIAVFAKLEREMIRERSMDARRKLVEDKKFVGGRFPYGLTPAPHPSGKGRVLVRDPIAVAVIQRMADALLSGKSCTAIAKKLNDQGVPTSRMAGATAKTTAQATYWRGNAVRSILRNRVQLGYRDGEFGPDGLPLVVWEPALSFDVWEAVQRTLDGATVQRVNRHDAHWLQGVALCGTCDAKLTQTVSHGITGMKCARPNEDRHKPAPYIRADDLSEWVNEQVLTIFSGTEVVENIYHAGTSHRQERLAVADGISAMRADREAGLYRGERDEAEYRERMGVLLARREALESEPDQPAGWVQRSTGQTFGEVWTSAGGDAKRRMLRDAGLCARIAPAGGRRLPVGERAVFGPVDPAAYEIEALRESLENE